MRLSLLPVFLLSGCCAVQPAPDRPDESSAAQPSSIEIMSFNIRYGTARDGEHAWPNRRELVAARIEGQQPDVLAIQEALDFQLDELASTLKGYRKLGQHREGGTRGEFSGLYVAEDRWQVLNWGEFWLSPTPDQVGVAGWDAALPRMAVWADLAPVNGGAQIRVYGTHYDHRGKLARAESSALIVAHAAEVAGAVVVTGDFNAIESSAALSPYFSNGFRSAMSELHPADSRGTFNSWSDPTGGRRIDHLLVRGAQPTRAEILSGRVGELFPSDHDAVVADFDYPVAAPSEE